MNAGDICLFHYRSSFSLLCKQCYFPEDPKIIKPGVKCILRMGVESSQKQSFVACISNLYGWLTRNSTTITDMKERIIHSMNLTEFSSYQNGNLVNDFSTSVDDPSIAELYSGSVYMQKWI